MVLIFAPSTLIQELQLAHLIRNKLYCKWGNNEMMGYDRPINSQLLRANKQSIARITITGGNASSMTKGYKSLL